MNKRYYLKKIDNNVMIVDRHGIAEYTITIHYLELIIAILKGNNVTVKNCNFRRNYIIRFLKKYS